MQSLDLDGFGLQAGMAGGLFLGLPHTALGQKLTICGKDVIVHAHES